ncbi:MAG: hypothetical protein ABGZ24_15275, partial [Fuerstiella sp.]
ISRTVVDGLLAGKHRSTTKGGCCEFASHRQYAPEEVHFSFRRWSSFQCLEVAGQKINLDPASVREEYLQRMQSFLQQLEDMVTGLGGNYVRMTTNHDIAETLGWFLRGRMAGG